MVFVIVTLLMIVNKIVIMNGVARLLSIIVTPALKAILVRMLGVKIVMVIVLQQQMRVVNVEYYLISVENVVVMALI